jgi:hypothetical protein
MFTLREIFYNGAASGPNAFSSSPTDAQRQAGIQSTSWRDWKLVANQDSKNKLDGPPGAVRLEGAALRA